MNLKNIIISILVLFVLPNPVYAHGGEEVEQAGASNVILNYGLILSGVLLVVSLGLWLFSKNKIKGLTGKGKETRKYKEKLLKFSKVYITIFIVSLLSVSIFGFDLLSQQSPADEDGSNTLTHIHGLGFSAEGKELYIPAHDGLRVYHDGHWAVPDGPKHDYMGFSMVDFGFYSSGHPELGSTMKNPFGIVKSTDMGQSLETLDLYEEIDFHGMAAGYSSHAIYVLNPEPNSRMEQPGLYYTLDETKTWEQSAMNGLEGQPATIAVHPTDPNVVAIGTNSGLYLSEDHGQTFTNILPNTITTAVHFNNDGNIVVGSVTNEEDYKVKLYVVNGQTNETEELSTPEIQKEDAISYISTNPQNGHVIAFATYNRDVFISNDRGGTWNKIAASGEGISGVE